MKTQRIEVKVPDTIPDPEFIVEARCSGTLDEYEAIEFAILPASEGKTKEEILRRDGYDMVIGTNVLNGIKECMDEYAQSRTQPEGVCEWKMEEYGAKPGCKELPLNQWAILDPEAIYCTFCAKPIKRV